MKKQDAVASLKLLILEKEAESNMEGKLLKDHFKVTCESLKPVNMIRSTINNVLDPSNLKINIIKVGIDVITGFLAKKIVAVKPENPCIKYSNIVLEMVVASKISKNADDARSIAEIILKNIGNHRTNSEKAY